MKRIAALVAVLALTMAAYSSLAQAGRAFMVTGGGQTDVDTTAGGAGDTIAFTARDTDGEEGNAAQGQVQYVDREGGKVVEVYHGTVTCLATASGGSDGAAYLAGTFQKQGIGTFEIYVADNGEPNQGADQIFIDQNDTINCTDDDDEEDTPTALARGNVQVHDAN